MSWLWMNRGESEEPTSGPRLLLEVYSGRRSRCRTIKQSVDRTRDHLREYLVYLRVCEEIIMDVEGTLARQDYADP